MTSNSSLECANSYIYNPSGSRCQSELLQALSDSNCQYQAGSQILITRDMSQLVDQFLLGLQGLGASSACQAEATTFACIYAYGPCSSSGVYLQPTLSQCEELRDSLCRTEWELAINFGTALPDCDQFPANPAICAQSDNITTNTSISTENINEEGMYYYVYILYNKYIIFFQKLCLHDSFLLAATQDSQATPSPLVCSDGFYQENGSQICIPSCSEFSQIDPVTVVVIDVLICLIAILGLVAGVVILIISCLDSKRM